MVLFFGSFWRFLSLGRRSSIKFACEPEISPALTCLSCGGKDAPEAPLNAPWGILCGSPPPVCHPQICCFLAVRNLTFWKRPLFELFLRLFWRLFWGAKWSVKTHCAQGPFSMVISVADWRVGRMNLHVLWEFQTAFSPLESPTRMQPSVSFA